MFLVALAAAAASPHSVTGAFGYTLGQAPPAKVAGCKSPYAMTPRIYICPGANSFTYIGLETRRNEVIRVSAVRKYEGLSLDAGRKACLADLGLIKADILRKAPSLLTVPSYRDGQFWLAEGLQNHMAPTGRTITGRCDVERPKLDRPDYKFISMQLSYAVSMQEDRQLMMLDQVGKK